MRKEPYIDFEATPQDQLLEIGRPGEVVLAGGRLWRSTIVRMGHQQADRILVLPDMKGIIAEFSCVKPIPGQEGLVDQASEPDKSKWTSQVHVWTSEGRTADPLQVFLLPFVARKSGEGEDASYLKPCFLEDQGREERASTD